LKSIAKDTNKTILISSHDLDLVLQIADQIWLMDFQKPIICGNGPDLIKDGALENVFSSPHGRFDASRGGFRIS
jgi:iron complex transport system ATP-binding protein